LEKDSSSFDHRLDLSGSFEADGLGEIWESIPISQEEQGKKQMEERRLTTQSGGANSYPVGPTA